MGLAAIFMVAAGPVACGVNDLAEEPGSSAAAPAASTTPQTTANAEFTLAAPDDPDGVTLADANYIEWSLLNRRTGQVAGTSGSSTMGNTVESMIKPWIVSDYLRRQTEDGEKPDEDTLDELRLMIIDSNDPLAEKYYQIGGADALVERLIDRCDLSDDVYIEPDLWGMTIMTPRDAVKYGACLADGRAAGPQWTAWVLDTMKAIRGDVSDQDSGEVQGGRWGIIDGLPPTLANQISFKNGWTLYEDGWHVNCLAIHRDWVLAIMMRMPDELEVAADGCKSITASLVVDHTP